jgi:hypothetical protein
VLTAQLAVINTVEKCMVLKERLWSDVTTGCSSTQRPQQVLASTPLFESLLMQLNTGASAYFDHQSVGTLPIL